MNTEYGSLELFLSYTPNHDVTIDLSTNILGVASFYAYDTDTQALAISLRIGSLYDAILDRTFIQVSSIIGTEIVDTSDYSCDLSVLDTAKIRIFFFNNRASVYLNNKWIYSYAFLSVSYLTDLVMSLIVNGGILTIEDIKVVELADGREAVYIDYEANTDSALYSIIQERPIEMYPGVERTFQFTYDSMKDDVPANNIRLYDETDSDVSQVSSDGLVYALDVTISIDLATAEELGLITKLYRLSDLDTGIRRAVEALQKKARQSQKRIHLEGRFDPRLELADVSTFNGLIITGTNRPITDRIILEEISMLLADGVYTSTQNGRRDVDNVPS